MLKNNNQEIVRKIAFRSMKQNRIRNGIVILAVILTTFMFTTIFTIGASIAEGMMVMLTRQQGTRSSIYLNNPTTEQIQQITDNHFDIQLKEKPKDANSDRNSIRFGR